MRTHKTYTTPFHYWISFFPTAPLFGVEWRFESMMPGVAYFRPSAVAAEMTRAGVREAAKATEEALETAAQAAEEAVGRSVEIVEAIGDHVGSAVEAFESAVVEPAVEILAEAVEALPPRPGNLLDMAPPMIDDLKLIKGVGPKLETLLNDLGVYTYAQVAEFSPSDLEWIDAHLGTFRGRPLRDDWIGQARALI